MKKIALIGPSFFSLVQSIQEEFSKRNISVEFLDERYSNTLAGKIIHRLFNFDVSWNPAQRHHERLLNNILSGGFDAVILINPERIRRCTVRSLKMAGVRVFLYMWDSAKIKSGFVEYLDLLDGKASFDPEDCSRYGLKYIPLFARNYFVNTNEGGERTLDIAFAGTLHSSRAHFLHQLEAYIKPKGLSFKALIYYHSLALAVSRSVLFPHTLFFIRRISSKGFSGSQISDLFCRSKYVIDIPQSGQKGLSARTFEALRCGAYLITFNAQAKLLPLDLASRVVLIQHLDELNSIPLCDEHLLDHRISADQDYYLSVARFVDQLMAMSIRE